MLKKFKTIDGVIYLALLVLVIVFRYLVLSNFAFRFTDSDQSIMWLGLKNYSKGLFYEPRFYGQSYSTMLEALLGIPLYKLGIPAYKALPLVTSFLALFPYIIISWLVFLKRSPKISFIILSLPLLLPAEYSLITSMPRGFVNGIFFSSLACIALFYPKSKGWFFMSSFLAVFAFTVNSNSVLLSLPVLVCLFLYNVRNKYYYIFTSTGLLLGFFIHFLIAWFYLLHPDYIVHKYDMTYSIQKVLSSLGQLNMYFNQVTPFFWKAGFSVLIMFFIISAFLFWKKKFNEAVTVAFIPFLVVATLGISKVHDGTPSVFFSYSRMYLALPVLLGVSLSFFSDFIKSKLSYLFLLIPFSLFAYHVVNLDAAIKINTGPKINHMVGIATVQQILDDCNKLKTICRDHCVELVIVSHHWSYDFFNYGCPACTDSFPNTLRPENERRTWRLVAAKRSIFRTILIIDVQRDFATEFKSIKKLPSPDGFYLVEYNTMYTMDLLDSLRIPYREFK
jgi:hypothetical protein